MIPDLGGHVHTVYDKVSGKQMLYENKYLKPSLISLRGAWTSGGIEFNTGPQGHTVTCLSPVEATFVEYEDGSKAIAIGNVESGKKFCFDSHSASRCSQIAYSTLSKSPNCDHTSTSTRFVTPEKTGTIAPSLTRWRWRS